MREVVRDKASRVEKGNKLQSAKGHQKEERKKSPGEGVGINVYKSGKERAGLERIGESSSHRTRHYRHSGSLSSS